MDDSLIFYALAIISVFSSLLVISQKQATKATIYLITHLFFTAGIYAYLGAKIVAAVQIILYINAILALFISAIKLPNFQPPSSEKITKPGKLELLTLASIIIGLMVFSWAGLVSNELSIKTSSHPIDPINTHDIGFQLLLRFKWPIALTSLLFLLTLIVCRFITKKYKNTPRSTGGGPIGSN